MTAILTTMRQSARDAINAWPALNVLRKKIFFEDSNALSMASQNPEFGALPCLKLYPSASQSPWTLNTAKEITYSLTCEIWTPHLNLPQAEQLWQDTVEALFKATETGQTEPIVKRATGSYPDVSAFNITLIDASDGENAVRVCQTTFQITLKYLGFRPQL